MFYIIYWILVLILRAFLVSNKMYKVNLAAGYDIGVYQQYHNRIEYHGTIKERILYTFIKYLGLIFSPVFVIKESLIYALPGIVILYLLNLLK